MAARKGIATRHVLSVPLAAAGSANDLVFATFAYDGFAHRATAAGTPGIGYDFGAEEVQEMSLTTGVALTGQATNFVSPTVIHRNAAGTTINNISVAFSGSTIVTVAFAPVNLAVASGATVPGAGAGVLVVTTGVALPWTLSPGDTISLSRVSNNGTGLATPAMSLTFLIASKGA